MPDPNPGGVQARVIGHLGRLYPGLDSGALADLADRVLVAVGGDGAELAGGEDRPAARLPGADEVVLITYGDSIVDPDRPAGPHLDVLARMLAGELGDAFSAVHVLPFLESSSDGGFSVVDYRRVDGPLGDWSNLAHAVGDRALMVDLVCNHGSARSERFAEFIADIEPGRSWYVTASPDADLSTVVRPRTHELLAPIETAGGLRHVWATFSHDQIDFDFANPDVLVEFCRIVGYYLDRGATRIRLDAIAYLWKELGTSCIHLPETHEVVKLFRTLVEARDPQVLIITETNVPHAENVSYFGAGDEAHVVYNFTFAPLIVWSVLAERGDVLTDWLAGLDAPPAGCTYLNFIASHDGLGLRPIEDLVDEADLALLLDGARAQGGTWSNYATSDGERPYELNVSLADLVAGPDGADLDRYVAAHAVLLAAQGIPAIYLHSMLGTPADLDQVAATGHARDINRARLDIGVAADALSSGWRGQAFERLANLIRVRRSQPAFGPESPQAVADLDPGVVALERGRGVDGVMALNNLTGSPVTVSVGDRWSDRDLILDRPAGLGAQGRITLEPWRSVWLPRAAG